MGDDASCILSSQSVVSATCLFPIGASPKEQYDITFVHIGGLKMVKISKIILGIYLGLKGFFMLIKNIQYYEGLFISTRAEMGVRRGGGPKFILGVSAFWNRIHFLAPFSICTFHRFWSFSVLSFQMATYMKL